tara:strand:+ start:44383 stop:44679 length:297 start_codon:yes stop_codon:yes gene_type:complete
MSSIEKIHLCDGKYTVVIEDGFKVSALRNGNLWRSDDEFVGDGLILAMASKLIEQDEKNAEMHEFLMHVLKCIEKNREYAPLTTEAIDKVLGIDRGSK